MPKSTSRRTSLQPVFEPFDLLEGTPIMAPVQTNGYHSEALTDTETISLNGHHGELNGATVNGATVNGATVNGAAINDDAIHGLDADPDLADLAAAKAAFSAEPVSEVQLPAVPSNNAVPSSNAVLSSNIANQNDTASQNGHASLNGDAELNGHPQSNGAAIAMPADSPQESFASPPVPAAPPIVGYDAARHSAEPAMEAPSTANTSTANASNVASSPAVATREPHPASGSLFTPYLVTEIRELRDRRQHRRGWWRRIFG